jgi:transposase InsO family protein/ribosomal protein L21E
MQQGRPIAYFSAALCPRNAAMSAYQKEALAIIEALKRWRHYFLGSKLVIKTDQQSLKFITDQRIAEGVQHKLMLKLLEFDFSIEYKKGKENVVADALSRKFWQLSAISSATPVWIRDITASYLQDPQVKSVLEQCLVTPTTPPPHYSVKAGVLRYKGRIVVGNNTPLRNQLMQALHSSAVGGHSGMRASYHRIKKLFYWPGLKRDVEQWVAQCVVCQRSKHEHCHYPGLLDPLPVPDMAWTHVSMDFVEGLPKSQGKDVIMVVVDKFTKFAHFVPLSHPYSVDTVAQAFIDNVIKLHGPPLLIISDRDRIFTSSMWRNIFKSLKVELRYSSAYHPQSDGQTERVNQCLETYLRSMTFQEPKKWMSWLSLAEFWYNTTYHTALQLTPFQALYGFPPPLISELSVPGPEDLAATDFLQAKQNMLTQLKHNLLQAQARMKRFADLQRTERHFEVGDMVYLKMEPYRLAAFGFRGSIKLQSKYYGPFQVLHKVGNRAYRLQLPEGVKIHPVFHVSQLKMHLGPKVVPSPDLPLVHPDDTIKIGPALVLEIRQISRNNEPVVQWLIQWDNLSLEDATWEDVDFIKQSFPAFFKTTVEAWASPTS